MKLPARTGFTLIELMIVVAIIGVLAAIAIPKFASLMRKSTEGSTKGNLGALRSALSIYYGDMEGQYPEGLVGLTVNGKYLTAIPRAQAPNYHSATANEEIFSVFAPFDDTGGWKYDDITSDPNYGTVWVNCTHTDTKGTFWTTY